MKCPPRHPLLSAIERLEYRLAEAERVRRGGRGSPWIVDLLKRKPPKLAAVALANKMARIAWKLMVTGNSYAAKSAPAALMGGA
jgi:transposase